MGRPATILNETPGCGHNGLALTKQKTFLIACSDKGAILEVDMAGKQLHRWDVDSQGKASDGGVNDIVVVKDPNDPKARGSIVKIANRPVVSPNLR